MIYLLTIECTNYKHTIECTNYKHIFYMHDKHIYLKREWYSCPVLYAKYIYNKVQYCMDYDTKLDTSKLYDIDDNNPVYIENFSSECVINEIEKAIEHKIFDEL